MIIFFTMLGFGKVKTKQEQVLGLVNEAFPSNRDKGLEKRRELYQSISNQTLKTKYIFDSVHQFGLTFTTRPDQLFGMKPEFSECLRYDGDLWSKLHTLESTHWAIPRVDSIDFQIGSPFNAAIDKEGLMWFPIRITEKCKEYIYRDILKKMPMDIAEPLARALHIRNIGTSYSERFISSQDDYLRILLEHESYYAEMSELMEYLEYVTSLNTARELGGVETLLMKIHDSVPTDLLAEFSILESDLSERQNLVLDILSPLEKLVNHEKKLTSDITFMIRELSKEVVQKHVSYTRNRWDNPRSSNHINQLSIEKYNCTPLEIPGYELIKDLKS